MTFIKLADDGPTVYKTREAAADDALRIQPELDTKYTIVLGIGEIWYIGVYNKAGYFIGFYKE